MLLDSHEFTGTTHYQVLAVKEDANYDEIRVGYKAAILNSHPDKLHTKPIESQLDCELHERFLSVQKAWEVLSDPTSRANYDMKLQSSRQKLEVVADEVTLEEMTVETLGDTQEFFYQCRCGDYFSVTSSEFDEIGLSQDINGEEASQSATGLQRASVLLPCGSCSLKIRLILDPVARNLHQIVNRPHLPVQEFDINVNPC